MVLGSRLDEESQIVSVRIQTTIQSIKEIVGNHSDADIYAMLKETNMDPNETTQKLLNQDPFHEVKRKRDKKKEHTGYRDSDDTNKSMEHNVQWAKSHASLGQNARRGGFTRKPAPDAGISQEFRIVRDNRVNQSASGDVKTESIQHSASGSDQVVSNVPEKSSAWVPTDQKKMTAKNSDGRILSKGGNEPGYSGAHHAKGAGSGGSHRPLLPEETQPTVSTSEAQSKLTSTNSIIGVYRSSSDPIHVPSPDSRSAGAVGAIRREVGAVGVRKQSYNYSTSRSSVSSSSFSVPLLGKDISLPAKSSVQSAAMPKSNQHIQTPSEPGLSSTSFSRSFLANQHHSRPYQQPVGHQKAMQAMEWKPKSSQKATAVSHVIETASSPHADDSGSSNPVDVPVLSEKLSQVGILETQHVIIPPHLRVPESEHMQLTFGSFGAGFDSAKGFTSTSQAFENAQEMGDEPSMSIPATGTVGSREDASAANQGDGGGQARTPEADSITSSTEYEEAQPEHSESLSSQNIESFEDIGLVQSDSPPYNSVETQQLQNQSTLPSFSAYNPQMSYDAPFFRTVMEGNERSQGLSSPSEALNYHAVSSSPLSITMVQQQPPVQPQQHPVAQLYPPVHISHYPNFLPYRPVLSPVYVPPLAMPNYSSNPAYPHPSNANNYVLMPGANSHITAGGMKYSSSQYKSIPVGSPTGYGNYANPAGFTISPGTIGSATGLEDATRIKYKENNLYIPAPQADTSDIWIQTPRELSGLQSAPYYNLSGQAPNAAFMPTHAGHATFNAAAQSSHVQYPGLYHPPQPASIAGPHQLVAPALGASLGVGVAAPGPQVGTYQQQPQLSHLNWTANF